MDRKLYNQVLDKLSPDLTIHFRNTLNFHKSELTISSRDNFLSWKFDNSFEDFMITNLKKSKQPEWLKEDGLSEEALKGAREQIATSDKCNAFKAALIVLIKENRLIHFPIRKSSENFSLAKDIFKSIKKDSFGFVYFIRNKDLYKIGISQNLLNRLNQLKPDEVLNTVRCSNYEDLEKELHKIFKDDRIPQAEYFLLTASQIEEIPRVMTTKAYFQKK